MGAKTDYEERFPKAGPLLTKKANLDGKLSAASRQNALAAALKEYGVIWAHDLRREVPVGRGLRSQDRPAAQQGRVHPLPAPLPPLRSSRTNRRGA